MSIASALQLADTVMIHGSLDDRFLRVRDALAANLASRVDIGSSAAVFIDGEPVVDIWGGHIDAARTKPWTTDTIVNTFSTTKTMTALCALILVDRGELHLDAPVAKYWPEFAAQNKLLVKVRHLLAHSSGLPGWTNPMTLSDILDREKSTSLLARQALWWGPGTATGYHPITYGPLIGEVIRRVTGLTLTRFFAEEVAAPLGADYHLGAGPDLDHRVSPLTNGSPRRPRAGAPTITDRIFFNPYVTPEDGSSIPWRRSELGGSNGHGNARSVAAIQSVLSNGGEARGVRLLSRAGAERALEMQADATDIVCGYQLRWGLGFGLGNAFINARFGNRIAGRRIAFWGGAGGSLVFNDFDARMTVAFVMNHHKEHGGGLDQRGVDIVCAAYDSIRGWR